jgi:hypothetical protein
MKQSPSQNKYRDRLIEKLRQQIQVNGENCPAADELKILLKSAGGVSTENAKGETEKPAEAQKE